MIPVFPVYLFDVDGTLVDSAADICGAIQGVLHEECLTSIPDSYLRRFIGRHLTELYTELFPAYPAREIERLVFRYRELYPQRNHASTMVYPEIPEVLARLGGKKATATTKSTATTHRILEMFGLLSFFDHVQGTDGFPAKPEPEVLYRAVEGLGASKRDCLLVGDSPADMEAAHRAGIPACAVTYGYGDRQELADWAPAYWIDRPMQLLAAEF